MNNDKKKIEPWRIAIFLIAVLAIIFMWVKKDVGAAYEGLSRAELVPLIITSVAVTLIKLILIALAVLLVKWLIKKFRK